ncbi:hypothetical protein GCM10009530_47120 [Microbispora corallina]|uniref:Uncharacterized protein n=1 Tax=Microbispora corallina TaxID=83302 RepID=A0ABQ4G5D6_9ACTN|nr:MULTISPECIES: hypothetical protein [Microbispora]GIH42287.1 hypothetical protein Mco01_52870 [Microbispora corallina]
MPAHPYAKRGKDQPRTPQPQPKHGFPPARQTPAPPMPARPIRAPRRIPRTK